VAPLIHGSAVTLLDRFKEKKKRLLDQAERNMLDKINDMYQIFKNGLNRMKGMAKTLRRKIDSQIAHVKNTEKKYSNMSKALFDELKKLEYDRQKTKSVAWGSDKELATIQTEFYGEACFRFDGVTGKIPSDKEHIVSEAMKSAIEFALVDEGYQVLVQDVVIIKQKLGAVRRRLEEANQIQSSSRDLARTKVLYVRALTSWLCRCSAEDLVSDAFHRRLTDEKSISALEKRVDRIDVDRELWSRKSIELLNDMLLPLLWGVFPTLQRVLPVPCNF